MTYSEILRRFQVPETLPSGIPHGDMPGDSVRVGETHIRKATAALKALAEPLGTLLDSRKNHRAVLAVAGGSGVGKSETASVLAAFLNQAGIRTYVLSGDNYPHRIPRDNDAERLRIFRSAGLRALADLGLCTPEVCAELKQLWLRDRDAAADPSILWLKTYYGAARSALSAYLGSPAETDFAELSRILTDFRSGRDVIPLKRMGREPEERWYDPVDFSKTNVVILEWTHALSAYLTGTDLTVLLNSTPQETLAHRLARKRDKGVDSPFTDTVLDIEQGQIEARAEQAALILAMDGTPVSYRAYRLQKAEGAAADE